MHNNDRSSVVSEPILLRYAAEWYIVHFGEDLPDGDKWLWVSGIRYYDEIPETDHYLIAGVNGLEGIVREEE